jgi:nitrogen fixation/metabolism regulation signal transduction histidine kinase
MSKTTTIAFTLGLVYACGTYLSLRLSRRIVTVIDTMSHAAQQIGMGDFSVKVPVTGDDQLGSLVASFNAMTLILRICASRTGPVLFSSAI